MYFLFFAYIALGRVRIAPKGCGEAPGHFPHQEKFLAQFFKNCLFEISGRICGYGPKYNLKGLVAFPQGLRLFQK